MIDLSLNVYHKQSEKDNTRKVTSFGDLKFRQFNNDVIDYEH